MCLKKVMWCIFGSMSERMLNLALNQQRGEWLDSNCYYFHNCGSTLAM